MRPIGLTAALAADLPTLADRALTLITTRVPCPVRTYRAIRADALALDLTGEAATDLRRRFNGFYGVRRNAVWRACFYGLFEAAKAASTTPVALFAETLARLAAETGRVEASFVSKLVATLRPEAPIIDSVVRAYLARGLDPPPFGGGLASAIAYYAWLEEVMTEVSATPQARAWSDVFDGAFPLPAGGVGVHPVKKLDFLIWAGSR